MPSLQSTVPFITGSCLSPFVARFFVELRNKTTSTVPAVFTCTKAIASRARDDLLTAVEMPP